jgi:N-acetylneuraminic acid mutarotase
MEEVEETESKSTRDIALTLFPIKPASGSKSVPSGRCGSSLTILGDALSKPVGLLLGGASDDSILGECFKFDFASTNWTLLKASGSFPPLFGHSADLYLNKLYIFGGLTISSMYTFDDMPESPDSPDLKESWGFSSARGYKASARFKERLFKSRGEEAQSEMYVLDIVSNTWSEVVFKGSAPSPRFMHSSCILDDKLVIFGGCMQSGYKESLSDLWVFDFVTGDWSKPKCTGSIPSARHGHSAVAVSKTRMYVFGGSNEDEGEDKIHRFNTLFEFDLESKAWRILETSGSPPLERAFHSSGLICLDGEKQYMYVFSGETNQVAAELVLLDISTS